MPTEVYHGGDRGEPGNDACCIEQSMTIASRGHQGITGILSFLSILWVRSDSGSQRSNFSMEGQPLPPDSILREVQCACMRLLSVAARLGPGVDGCGNFKLATRQVPILAGYFEEPCRIFYWEVHDIGEAEEIHASQRRCGGF